MRVDDESASASPGRHMFAAGPMTGFAAGSADHLQILLVNPSMGARWKKSCDVRMAIGAGLVADKGRTFNLRWAVDRPLDCGTRAN